MKRIKYILFFINIITFMSCEDWFDVKPDNQVSSDDLYSTGSGYRMQLNGIYMGLSETSLYGENLSWGFMDILGQYYTEECLTDDQKDINNFLYKGNVVKGLASTIWSKMYHVRADCNDLIDHVSKESASAFEFGEIEKAKIYGEALAMRAFVHFDLLRLFAPAKDDGKRYIPYVTDINGTINIPLTVNQTLERIVNDLKEAQPLLVQWDSSYVIEDDRSVIRIAKVLRDTRFTLFWNEYETKVVSYFEKRPGYRMHYAAARAILARVYSYMGLQKEAYDEAYAVCNLKESRWSNPFDFNYEWDIDGTSENGNKKLLGDVIMAFYNEKNADNFKPYLSTSPLYYRNLNGLFSGDALGSDVRYLYLTMNYRDGGRVSVKNRQGTTDVEAIPVIRKAELYYIMGEYLASHGDVEGACELLQEIKERRNDITLWPNINNATEFMDFMLIDARREFMGEGQSFFMYKRLNRSLWDGASSIDLTGRSYLPIPDSENVLL